MLKPALAGIAARRLLAQRLVGEPCAEPSEVVRRLTAVQAQDYAGAKWAIGQRCRSARDADVEAAFQSGQLLRTHVLRPTWHFVLPEDVRWLLALTAPRVHAANGGMYRKLELDAATFRRSETAIARALGAGRALTREELGRALQGARVAADGLRLGYLMMHAELEGLICSGPRRGKQFTYRLLDDCARPGRALPRDEALARLARRYFESHGPATLHDFAWWAGLTVADARHGAELCQHRLTRETIDDKTYFFVPPAPDTARAARLTLHLLPNYDEHLIAYKDYGPVFDPRSLTSVGKRDQILANHLVVRNGQVAGGWRRILGKKSVLVEVTLLASFDAKSQRALDAAAERFGRFLALPVELRRS